MVDGNEEERSAGNEAQIQDDVSAKDSTSSAISEKEISEMRQTNPLAAFRLLLSLSTSSTNLATSSSTTSLTSINQESTEELLRQLKAKILEGDILARIGENPVECFEIKELLQKLHKLGPSPELLAFLMEFGPIFETLSLNIKHRAETLKQKEQEQKLHQQGLDSLKASQTKIDNLEAQKVKNAKDMADWEITIQRYKDEIEELQSKLRNAEHERNLLQERMGNPASKIEDEAVKGLGHLDNVVKQQAIIAQLDKELSQLETSIAVGAKVLDKLKDSLKNIQ